MNINYAKSPHVYRDKAEHLVRNHPANKELMELGFGCEVEMLSRVVIKDPITEEDKTVGEVLFYDKGGSSFDGETTEYYGDTLKVWFPDWMKTEVWGEWGDGDDVPKYKILGKPAHLISYLRVLDKENQHKLLDMIDLEKGMQKQTEDFYRQYLDMVNQPQT